MNTGTLTLMHTTYIYLGLHTHTQSKDKSVKLKKKKKLNDCIKMGICRKRIFIFAQDKRTDWRNHPRHRAHRETGGIIQNAVLFICSLFYMHLFIYLFCVHACTCAQAGHSTHMEARGQFPKVGSTMWIPGIKPELSNLVESFLFLFNCVCACVHMCV